MILLSKKQEEIVKKLNHSLFNAALLERRLNNEDAPYEDPYTAVETARAHGFYEAVKCIEALDRENE